MFERQFEFTVHQPLEVCEERILALQNQTVSSIRANNIFSRITSAEGDTIEAELHLPTYHIHADVTMAAQTVTSTHVSGSASIQIFWFDYVLYGISGVIVLASILWALVSWQSEPLAFVFFFGIVMSGNFAGRINGRNELIKKLEETMTQQKKKKV